MRVVNDGHGICHPLEKRVIAELSAASAVPVHIHPQGCITEVIERFGCSCDMPFFHMTGKTVDDDDERAFSVMAVRHVELCVQVYSVVCQNHRLISSFVRIYLCYISALPE